MREPKYFDSAYPGSMSERKDGSYVEREDSQSLALALLENLYAAQRDAEDWKDQAIAWENQLHAETAALQCKIDALMLEYCPDEMTEAQKENWASDGGLSDGMPEVRMQDDVSVRRRGRPTGRPT